MLELMTVVAVIAILVTIALPNVQDRLVRDQVVQAAKLADIAKTPIAASWTLTQTFPLDNSAAGLPVADKVVGNLVRSVLVDHGAIHITFGNHANGAIQGKVLTLRPAVVTDAPIVPVAWVCGNASPPHKMTVQGVNLTNLPPRFLPMNCR